METGVGMYKTFNYGKKRAVQKLVSEHQLESSLIGVGQRKGSVLCLGYSCACTTTSKSHNFFPDVSESPFRGPHPTDKLGPHVPIAWVDPTYLENSKLGLLLLPGMALLPPI